MLLLECAAYALTPRAIAASQAWIFTACRVLSGGGFATLNSNVTPLLARMFGTVHSSKERRRPLFWQPFWTVTQPARVAYLKECGSPTYS